ncbi:hypothetical protein [Teredinibacter turnerae]|uniref:hypothetical protein n=1 Tax=Teredinibacter turnerae TaxID=2426 RepID=UPI0003FB7D27|nr:hypothetical protein [Teredinibacter turnerae]
MELGLIDLLDLSIDNAGKGPAVIEGFSMNVGVDKTPEKSNEFWWNTLTKLGFSGETIDDFRYVYLPIGVSLREGGEIYLMGSAK